MRNATALVGMMMVAAAVVNGQEARRDHVTYVERYQDPVLVEMEAANEALTSAAEAKTDEIVKRLKEEKKQREESRPKLRFPMQEIPRPAGPDGFATKLWHFPPTPQYLTGSCWSFAATSFLESEVKRMSGREVKLSEMWSVYWEWVAKARGFIGSRGQTVFEEGSQSGAVLRALEEHGMVPRSASEGVLAADGRFNHALIHESMKELLGWCREKNFWDEETIIVMIRRILDANMGAPPESVVWEGKTYTPKEFLSQVGRLIPTDYVELMSTLSEPMWARGEYRVEDNWWHAADYVNVPLDVWYATILKAVGGGYSVVIGGDVSEPGLNGFEDIAVVPTFDIPSEYIDQDAREFRFANETTSDDHGIHLVGHTRLDGHDWFLIKDSNRSSRWGKYEGYYMYRDDYVRLKMLTFMVHRDVVADILARVDSQATSE